MCRDRDRCPSGLGGIGMTPLAGAVGERLVDRFGRRTAFVPLAAVTEPELVLAGAARTVGVELAGSGSPLEALVEYFGEERWLLILDNLEQVVDAAGDIDPLLPRCRGVVILATSRTVLGLRAVRSTRAGSRTVCRLPLALELLSVTEPATATAGG
jgi:predicted ATPase